MQLLFETYVQVIHVLLGGPFDRLWFKTSGQWRSAIFASTSFKATDNTDGHICFAQNLATQSHAGCALCGENVLFRNGHFVWFAIDEFNATCRAAGFSSACMQLIRLGFISECGCKSLSFWNFKYSDSLDR
jgi:hypothetical protein